MPNRIIRESCRSSPTLDALSAEAERMFWRLTTVADDYGRFEADPRLLLASCFPLAVDRIKATTVAKWFGELVASGAVLAYVVDGRAYGVFRSWAKHQRVRESKPKYPEPLDAPAAVGGDSPRLAADCGLARALDYGSGLGSRGGEEREKRGGAPDDFATWYAAYPRKKKPADAEKAWQQTARDRPPLADMLRVLAQQRASPEWRKDGGQFVPYPASYLRAHSWADDLGPPAVSDRPPVNLAAIRVHPIAAKHNAIDDARRAAQGVPRA